MTQFNKAEARRIFEQYPEANYVAQDEDGEVDIYEFHPHISNDIWDEINGWSECLDNYYTEHPDGWENSLYSRADMEGE